MRKLAVLAAVCFLLLVALAAFMPAQAGGTAQTDPEYHCNIAINNTFTFIDEGQGSDDRASNLMWLSSLQEKLDAVKAECKNVVAELTGVPTATDTPEATLSRQQIVDATRTSVAEDKESTAIAKTSTVEWIAQFKTIDRRELVSYADRHKGEKIKVRGRVFNILGDDQFQIFLAGSNDAAFVVLHGTMSGIYENDFVTVYGTVGGTYSGTNSYGGTITQPLIIDASVTKP